MEIMTTQHPLPEREVFEREIHDLFENGDLSSIARYLHKDLDTQIREFQEARDAYDAKIKALIAMRMPTRQAAATATFAKFNGNGRK